MDNHPIPQDVTGFQFRLIGNMTVKQFAYVAVGSVGAVIIFYLPIFAFIKILLIPLFIIAGVSLAFLPIAGRPVDVMVSHFIHALLSPTQFLYHKEGGHLLLSTIRIDQKAVNEAAAQAQGKQQSRVTQEQKHNARKQQLSAYLTSIHQDMDTDDREANRLSTLFTPPAGVAPAPNLQTPVQPVAQTAAAPTVEPVAPIVQEAAIPNPVIPPVSVAPEPQKNEVVSPEAAPVIPEIAPDTDTDTVIQIQKDVEKIAEDETLIQQMSDELNRAKAAEQTATGEIDQSAHAKVLAVEQKLQALTAAKVELEAELQSLKQSQTKKVISTPAIQTVPVPPAQTPPTEQPSEPAIATPAPLQPAKVAPSAASAGFPSLPDVPNVLLGVVRDSSGNVLPHILVDVQDGEGNPVRAFKTNQLGQFLSATPIKEGTYTIHLEDSKNQYKFDVYPLVVNNQIMQPLEIGAHDLREELRKSLFA